MYVKLRDLGWDDIDGEIILPESEDDNAQHIP